MSESLFSVVLTGRNDNYGGVFLKRLELCINYFVYSMDRANTNVSFEIVVVDWGSDESLAGVLNLNKLAQNVVRFVKVPKDVAELYNPEGKNFNSPVSLNAGIVRAYGKYVVHMPADILFTSYSLSRLCDILQNKVHLYFEPVNSIMLIKRYLIPQAFNETKKSLQDIDRYLSLSNNWLETNAINGGISADFGALICTKKSWCDLGGFDESLPGWGKSDSRFGFMASVDFPIYELSGLGVCCYDPTVDNVNIGLKLKNSNKLSNIDYTHRPKNIGIPQYELEEERAKVTKEEECGSIKEEVLFDKIDLFAGSLQPEIKQRLPFNSVEILPCMYPLYWYIKNVGVDVFCEFVAGDEHRNERSMDITLGTESIAALISAVNPAAEMISIIPKIEGTAGEISHKLLGRQYLNKKSRQLSFLRTLVGELFPRENLLHKWHPGFAQESHHGLVHYITGDTSTAIGRIRKMFDTKMRADVVLFRVSEFLDPEVAFDDVLGFAGEFALILVVDSYNSLLTKLPEKIGEQCTVMIDNKLGLGVVINGKSAGLDEYAKGRFAKDTKTWKKRFLPWNYLLSIIFSRVTLLKKKLER